MTSAERAVPSPTEFIRSNLVWIFGLVPVALAGLRIWTVSRGDTEVFLYLMKNLNVVQLILAIIIPLTPVMVFWAWVAWVDWQRRTPRAKQVEMIPDWVDIPIFIAVSGVVIWMPLHQLILCVIALILIVYVRRRARKRAALRWGPDHGWTLRPVIWDIRGFALSLVASTAISASVIWIPPETIKIANSDTQAGFVLSYDDKWTTVLSRDGKVQVFQSSKLESRKPCTADWSWFGRPLLKLFSSTPPYD